MQGSTGKPPIPEVLFIGGTGRSGSTLIANTLAQHPDVVTIGESQYLWDRGLRANDLCGCGAPFRSCDFWFEVGKRAFGDWDDLDLNRVLAVRDLVDRQRRVPQLLASRKSSRFTSALAHYVDVISSLYAGIAETSGKAVIVDSTKHSSYPFVLRHLRSVDTRIVHSLRDSRAVAHAWAKTVRRAEVTDRVEFMPKHKPHWTARQWAISCLLIECLPVLGLPVLDVRYEDLVQDPQGEIARILGFAGVPVDPDIAFVGPDWVELEPTHTVSGNNSRFRTGRVPVRLDDSWRSHLASKDRRVVTTLTWPLLRHYGYM